MSYRPRVGKATLALLDLMESDISREWYGFELMRATGLQSGVVYPVLARLERAGWLIRWADDIETREPGRPPRRLCRLTEEGQRVARAVLTKRGVRIAPADTP